MIVLQLSCRGSSRESCGLRYCGERFISAADETAEQCKQAVCRGNGADAVCTGRRNASCRRIECSSSERRLARAAANHVVRNVWSAECARSKGIGTELIILSAEPNGMISLDPHCVV